jgi:hypothetical protein
MLNVSDLRKQAALARRLAEQTYSETGRTEFLRIAEQCDREADTLESERSEWHEAKETPRRRFDAFNS